jgi:hypothetical protein
VYLNGRTLNNHNGSILAVEAAAAAVMAGNMPSFHTFIGYLFRLPGWIQLYSLFDHLSSSIRIACPYNFNSFVSAVSIIVSLPPVHFIPSFRVLSRLHNFTLLK